MTTSSFNTSNTSSFTPSAASAATLVSAQALQLESHDDWLFQDISFTLKLGDRIGLIGHNGCGKSTLLNLISSAAPALVGSSAHPARSLEASGGTLHFARACRMQHVEQHLPAALNDLTLYDALLQPVSEQPELHWRVDSLLAQLGIDAATAAVPVHSLSGGQHTRLLLGRALLQEPNLLLLDEPSNHLDLPSLLWLESFLRDWRGAFVLVSHDQRLLDNVTRKSWILRDQRLYNFELPCGAAMAALADLDDAASARHAAEQKEIDRLAASSKRLAIWGKTYDNEDLARKAKTMQKRVEKLKEAQSFVTQGPPWQLSLRGKALAANQLLRLEQVPVMPCAGGPLLFTVDQLWLKPGDKIALLGANGSGKRPLCACAGKRLHPCVTRARRAVASGLRRACISTRRCKSVITTRRSGNCPIPQTCRMRYTRLPPCRIKPSGAPKWRGGRR